MKKLLFLLLFITSFIQAQDTGISALPEKTVPGETDITILEDAEATKKITYLNFIKGLLDRQNEWTKRNTFNGLTYFDSTSVLRGNQKYVSSTYVPGWTGSGFQLDYGLTELSKSNLVVDNMTVRGRLSVYELLIRQLRTSTGNIIISNGGKVKYAAGLAVVFEDVEGDTTFHPFQVGDLIMAQKYSSSGTQVIRQVKASVDSVFFLTSVEGDKLPVTTVTYADTNRFRPGDEVVRLGSLTNADRRGTIYLASDDEGAPFIDVKSNVNSFAAFDADSTVKVRLGRLEGYQHPYFGELSGYGLLADNVYLDNAYFRGEAIFTNPEEVADSLKNYLSISASWDSLTNRPTYFSTPTGSGLFLSATHMGYYTGGNWKTYWDNNGNLVAGNIGSGGQGFSWNQSAGTMSISGSLKIFNKQEISDSLKFSTVFRQASAPTIRPDGTSLKDNDLWIDSDDNNRRYIRSGGSWVSISAGWINPTWTSGTSFPGSPAEGDWHFWTGAEGTYRKNTWYQYVSSTWTARGLYGTYIDDTGLYTGTVVANNILAGTGLINNLSVLSTLTVGSAGTDGYIQSYGWNGTVNGFQIKGGSTPTINLIGGSFTSSTITGGTIQTATGGGQKIVIDGTSGGQLRFYNSSGTNTIKMGEEAAGIGTPTGITINNGMLYSTTNLSYYAIYGGTSATSAVAIRGFGQGGTSTTGVEGIAQGSGVNYAIRGTGYEGYGGTTNWAGYFELGSVAMGSEKMIIDGSGRITKVNNTAASGNQYKVLASDNTSYTPVTLTSSHLPSTVVYTNTTQTISGAKTFSGVQSFRNEIRTTNVLTVYGTESYGVAGYNVVNASPPTSGQTITLTGMTTGQNIFVTNTSRSLAITICGVSLPAGKSMYARYNGSSWNTVIGN